MFGLMLFFVTVIVLYSLNHTDSIVLEVYSDGGEPYPGLTNIQTRAKIVVQNFRMEMPKDTPSAVSALVTECWAKEPNDRPTFAKIFDVLSKEYKIVYGAATTTKDEMAITKKEKKKK